MAGKVKRDGATLDFETQLWAAEDKHDPTRHIYVLDKKPGTSRSPFNLPQYQRQDTPKAHTKLSTSERITNG